MDKKISINQLWWIWFCAAIVIFLIQAFTADVMPCMQQDEAQITDYGRLILHPTSEWSINWLLEERKPLMLWSYLGPLMAETSYQAFGNYGVGPRFAALLGGVVAATMLLGWLLSRKIPFLAATFLSLAFLLDPLFVLTQRMGRVDSWVIACCLGSCWLLRIAAAKQKVIAWVFLAGGLAAMALLIWPSAIFLYPLVCLELFQLSQFKKASGEAWNRVLALSAYFIGGGFCFLALLLMPVLKSLLIVFDDLARMVSLNIKSTVPLQERLWGLFNFQLWFKLIKALIKTFSPLFPVVAILSLIYRQKKELLFITLLAIALIFATLVYEFRALYLLPYFIVMSGTIFMRISEGQLSTIKIKIGMVALFVLVFWSFGISLFVRSYLAVSVKERQSRSIVYQAALASIGFGKHKVFLASTYELYFVGRTLGWELFSIYPIISYDKQGNWMRENEYSPRDKFMELLSKMDFAVFPDGALTKELDGQLTKCGLQYQGTMIINNQHGKSDSIHGNNRYWNILLMFLQGSKDYGPYLLYKRQVATIAQKQ